MIGRGLQNASRLGVVRGSRPGRGSPFLILRALRGFRTKSPPLHHMVPGNVEMLATFPSARRGLNETGRIERFVAPADAFGREARGLRTNTFENPGLNGEAAS